MKVEYQTMLRENSKQFQVQLLNMIFNENKISTIKFWNKYLVFRSIFAVKKQKPKSLLFFDSSVSLLTRIHVNGSTLLLITR